MLTFSASRFMFSLQTDKQISKRPPKLRHLTPDVRSYEEQKRLTVTARPLEPIWFPQQEHIESVFAGRLDALIDGKPEATPSIFPGAYIPSPGDQHGFVCRGMFFREQYHYFKKFGWFQEQFVELTQHQIQGAKPWPWVRIGQPSLACVGSLTADLHKSGENRGPTPTTINSTLAQVRRHWDVEKGEYSFTALEICRGWVKALKNLSISSMLTGLFELEAFASYITLTERLPIFLSGTLAGNWIFIYRLPLKSIRQTELCFTSRIFDELLNLRSSRFAPIVINEYMTVADGNHRLTSAWIWNLLHYCVQIPWKIQSLEFQQEMHAAVRATNLLNHQVSLREALFHLGIMLANSDLAAQLESRLKPAMVRMDSISEIPVVVVPEYLSCAAQKAEYDAGTQVIRSHPALYRAIASAPPLVLPPRASYHYTDRVLLPWFQVTG